MDWIHVGIGVLSLAVVLLAIAVTYQGQKVGALVAEIRADRKEREVARTEKAQEVIGALRRRPKRAG